MEVSVRKMIKRYSDRLVIEFLKDEENAIHLIDKLKRRRIICMREIVKLCKEFFGTDFEFCRKAVVSLMEFERINIDEKKELNLLLRGKYSKDFLLFLLNCGSFRRREIQPKDFIRVMNYYMVKQALKDAARVEIVIEGELPSSSIKWAMYLAKKSRVPVEISKKGNYIIISSELPRESRIDKLSLEYRVFPEIFATILSLTSNWKMIAIFDAGFKLKLRSDSPWIADFKPPWYLKGETISFDSDVEKVVFEALREIGCNVQREPDVILIGNEIIIPDFSIECCGRKLYVEVVGYWTKRYIKKKKEKLEKLKGRVIAIIDERLREHFESGVFYSYPPKKEDIKKKLREVLKC